MKKYWVEFQYNLGGLTQDLDAVAGFGALEVGMSITKENIIGLKKRIAKEISLKALTQRGINIAENRKGSYEITKEFFGSQQYPDDHNFDVQPDEINLTLVLELGE